MLNSFLIMGSGHAFATATKKPSTKSSTTSSVRSSATKGTAPQRKVTASGRKLAAKKATEQRPVKHNGKVGKKPKIVKEYTKPPKRPLTPYVRFLGDLQKDAPRQNSIEGNIEFIRETAQRWRSLSPAEKLPYEREFAQERERHILERDAWIKSLSPRGLRQYRAAVRKRHIKARPKDQSGKPLKRAPSAYNIYSKEAIVKKRKPGERASQYLAEIGQEWRHLSEAEKAQYESRAAAGRIPYKQAKDKRKDETRARFYEVHKLNT
ncbi:high mobility group box domain-containing protein [Cantharellus anzutake]|uniref:high mobility group box domain-containing protein n=1 Tax=Cantharellus anzutake TaxID=1750568 RepID=UPI0019041084|nr:high mobility group box domain-containing protein [Cantharellus anzutake]KAF8326813.1 high mobility group box domain-containing protein [Cantharellus anzutake]